MVPLTATLGSLYFSEVAEFTPCTLCWYQRIAMYPPARGRAGRRRSARRPLLTEWLRAGDAPEGLDVVAVSTSVEERAPNDPPSAWLEREGWPAPVLVDDAAAAPGAPTA